MMAYQKNTSEFPYFKIKNQPKEKALANFLLRKFRPKLKQRFPQHYLIQPISLKTLNFIKDTAKKYPYFIRFDIKLYYPSINHKTMVEKLPKIYQKITKLILSRNFKKYLKNDIPKFLSRSPYNKGLSIGSKLSWILAGIFLLDLDLEFKNSFLRQNDDYLIFCKNKKEPEKLLKNVISPKLKELNLEINEKKLKSGKFHQDKVNFIGFDFYASYFTISEEKIDGFKRKIIKITYLTKKKPKEAVIKLLNNQILGFGHYYKSSSCKRTYRELDSFVRMRLRRWLLTKKELLPKEGNLILTNEVLKNLGLKSLIEIKERFDTKKRQKIRKSDKNKQKTGQSNLKRLNFKSRFNLDKYEQKLLLNQLEQLTSSLKRVEKRLANLENKLVKQNGSNS